ncbi:hypothetical protein NSB23_03165 [Phocaeicola vulgatus]|nr:hypothetical protein [Phocaeicola vulgatus]
MAKNLKQLIFSRSPVGQEEKTGLTRFPLAILSAASHPANTLPCGMAKARTRGTGRCRSEALRKNLFHTQKNDTTDCIKTEKNVMHITKYKKAAFLLVLFGKIAYLCCVPTLVHIKRKEQYATSNIKRI